MARKTSAGAEMEAGLIGGPAQAASENNAMILGRLVPLDAYNERSLVESREQRSNGW